MQTSNTSHIYDVRYDYMFDIKNTFYFPVWRLSKRSRSKYLNCGFLDCYANISYKFWYRWLLL